MSLQAGNPGRSGLWPSMRCDVLGSGKAGPQQGPGFSQPGFRDQQPVQCAGCAQTALTATPHIPTHRLKLSVHVHALLQRRAAVPGAPAAAVKWGACCWAERQPCRHCRPCCCQMLDRTAAPAVGTGAPPRQCGTHRKARVLPTVAAQGGYPANVKRLACTCSSICTCEGASEPQGGLLPPGS